MGEVGCTLQNRVGGAETGHGRQEGCGWGVWPRGHEKAATPGLCSVAAGCGGLTKPDGRDVKAGQKDNKADEGEAFGYELTHGSGLQPSA